MDGPSGTQSNNEDSPPAIITNQAFELEMMRLRLQIAQAEAQKLAEQRQLAEKGLLQQTTAPPVAPHQRDKINIFHKYIATKALKLLFKLEGQSNYTN